MEIPAFFKAIVDQQGQRMSGEMPRLRVGQELVGKVVRLEADGRLLIDLGSFRALARSNIEVQPGMMMRLQVVKAGIPLHLQAVETPSSQSASAASAGPLPRLAFNEVLAPSDQQRLTTLLRQTLDAQVGRSTEQSLPPRVQNAMAQIRTLFDPLPINRSVGQIARYLKTMVEDSGLFFEKKLADAVLSGMASRAAAASATQVPGEKGQVTQAGATPADVQSQTRATPVEPDTQSPVRTASTPSSPQVPTPQTPVKDIFVPLFPREQTRETAVRDSIPDQPRPEETRAEQQTDTRAEMESDLQVRTIVGRDVKSQLMILREFLSSSPESRILSDILTEKETAFLRGAVQRLLTHVESQQERASQRSGEADVFQVFTHWIPVESQSAPVRFKVYYPRKKNAGEGQNQKVALLLELDRLGMLRIDLSMVERMLRIDFYVQDENVRLAIASEADEMSVSLNNMFEQVFISTYLSEEKITQFEQEDINTAAVGRIDIQV